jgi:3-oxoacyl-(acyl-carrier-protein) synthase
VSALPAELLDGVVVTGAGSATDPTLDPRPLLKERKMRKFMGAQDRLALAAARAALDSAGLEPEGPELGPKAGLYLCVGYLPFEREDVDLVCEGSCTPEGRFDLSAFVGAGYEAINPLLTFRCLSNMPAYHSSTNLGVQGPYVTSYAGRGQLYTCLEEALWALHEGQIERALWGGVAYQQNFLVEHHLTRVERPLGASGQTLPLGDAAGLLVLEREAAAEARGATLRARLREVELDYLPRDPATSPPEPPRESFHGGAWSPERDLGVASLPAAFPQLFNEPATWTHEAWTDDGYRLRSAWEVLS